MVQIQGQKRLKKKLYANTILVLAILLVVVLVKPTWNIWRKYLTSKHELAIAKQELQELKIRKTEIESELESLDTQAGQEREAIKKFNLVREGEELAVIIEPEEIPVEEETKKGFIKRFFKKYFKWPFGRDS